MVDLEQLYLLQQLDLKIDGLTTSLDAVRSKLNIDGPALTARTRVATLEAHMESLYARRRASERSLTELNDQLTAEDTRLYSGSITSTKEMQAAQEEHDFTKEQIGKTEEGLLTLMVGIEDAEKTLTKGHKVLETLEAQADRQTAELAEEESSLVNQLKVLTPERDSSAKQIDSKLVYRYETLRKSKNGHVIAKVEREMCQGCRIKLTTSELQRIQMATDLVQCDSCHRILYFG